MDELVADWVVLVEVEEFVVKGVEFVIVEVEEELVVDGEV